MTTGQADLQLPFTPAAAARARSEVRQRAAGMAPEVVEDAELLVSELVTNALRHGAPALRLFVQAHENQLRVRVSDGGSGLPARTEPPPSAEAISGRGLRIVEAVATAWGTDIDPVNGGKTVWFHLTDSARPQTAEAASSRR